MASWSIWFSLVKIYLSSFSDMILLSQRACLRLSYMQFARNTGAPVGAGATKSVIITRNADLAMVRRRTRFCTKRTVHLHVHQTNTPGGYRSVLSCSTGNTTSEVLQTPSNTYHQHNTASLSSTLLPTRKHKRKHA